VDDEPSIRRHFEHELSRRGYRVVLAENGLEAIQKARALKPALMLLDIMMPDLMGLDVIRILKNDPATSAIPVVVVSVVEDRERGLQLGASDYLTKPVKPQALVGRIESLLSQRRPLVLLVSGDVEGSADIHEILAQTRYQLECSATSEEARERLAAGDVDLVVLDGQDPTIDAPAILRDLRGNAQLAVTPVIVLTAQCVEGVEICRANSPAERYMPRDSGPASITQTLQELLNRPEPAEEAA
jgi:DNA-binding response OmpR family regulator